MGKLGIASETNIGRKQRLHAYRIAMIRMDDISLGIYICGKLYFLQNICRSLKLINDLLRSNHLRCVH